MLTRSQSLFFGLLVSILVLFIMPVNLQTARAGSDSLSGAVTASDGTDLRLISYPNNHTTYEVYHDIIRADHSGYTGQYTVDVTISGDVLWYVYAPTFYPGNPTVNYYNGPYNNSGSVTISDYGIFLEVVIAGNTTSSTGTWTVSVSGPGTVTLSDMGAPPVPLPPTITGQPGSTTISHNQTTTLSVAATGATSYQWYQGASGDESNPVGTSSSSYTTPTLTALGSPYSYWVKVTNANGSVNSNTATVTVNKATPTTSITSHTPFPSIYNTPVSVGVSMTSGAGTPTGTVTVSDGTDSCNITLAGGAGSCNITLTTQGARTLTATYHGDANFNSSTSAGQSHTVNFGTLSITPGSLNIVEAAPGSSYNIGLDNTPSGTVIVQVSFDDAQLTVNGSSTSPITLSFTNTTPQAVTVSANDTPFAEGLRMDTITHAIISGTAEYPTSLTLSDVTVNIGDDDVAGVTVDPAGVDASEDGITDSYTINLNTLPTSGSVTIDISFDTAQVTVNGSSTSPVTLTFTDTTPQTVTVGAVDNNTAEGNRTSTLTHAITAGPAEYTGAISISDVTVNVLDDDMPGVRVSETSFMLEDKGDTVHYTISLVTEPTASPVSLSVAFNNRRVEVNGSNVSPVLIDLTDTTPVTITVRALANGLSTRINHSISASAATEYPTSLSISPVSITVENDDPPPPPPVPNARDWNFDTEAPVRTHVPHHLEDFVFVRLIVDNGHYVVWFGSELYDDGNIGILDVIHRNILQAVDVFTQDFTPVFDGDVVVCLRGMGEMIFMDANDAPRVARTVTGWMTPAFPGYTCATLYTPGTLVLVEGPAPTIMATEAAPLSAPVSYESQAIGCYLTTLASDYVNLREQPDMSSAVLTVIPPNDMRWTTEFANGFYKVQYGSYFGWLHESAVVAADTCDI